MTFITTATVMVMAMALFGITIAGPGQVANIASNLDTAGRNFSCTGELVVYTCSGQGTTLFVNSPPLFSQHAFRSIDPVPDAQLFLSAPNVILTLTSGMPNYTANLQITVLNDTEQMRINVSCSTSIGNTPNVLPLIHESQIEPPFTASYCYTSQSVVQVSWTPPVDPKFDIDYYVVRFHGTDGELYEISRSRDVYLNVMEFGKVKTVSVSVVTTCGISAERSASENGNCRLGSLSKECDAACYAGFLIPTFIGILLIIAVVVLTILFVRLKMRDQSCKQPDESSDQIGSLGADFKVDDIDDFEMHRKSNQ